MRVGQTSIIVFSAKILAAAFGFLATVVFARIVGAEVLGIYALVLTIVSWVSFTTDVGVGGAIGKRISEDEEPHEFLTAGLLWIVVLAIVLSLALVGARPAVERYVSDFDQYVALSVVWFVIALLFIRVFYTFPSRILKAERRVHVAGLLEPVRQGLQSLFQVALVLAGFSLFGMLTGYLIGGVLVGLAGIYFVSLRPARPSTRHFRDLFEYAKYSWLGKLKTRIFNEVDVLILALFVSSSAIGVYAVAWSLAKFLGLFSNSISTTLFPEISYSSTQESTEVVRGFVEDALMYAGLIAIPGLVGGFLLARELMFIYGPEFIDGATVLWVLILAVLIFAYQKQFVNALNGIDRPDLAFWVNLLFALTNVGLNLLFIPQYGIEGAAIASVVSVTVALVVGYYYLAQIVEFTIPFGEIARQIFAALLMGVIVASGQEFIEVLGVLQRNIFIVLILVGGGACTYFLTMIAISANFRKTINRNSPINISDIFR